MDKDKAEAALGLFNGAEPGFPFGPEAKVFKVMGKMFALVSQQDEPARVTLKASPAEVETLIEEFDSVSPGYYMNKKHWVTISLDGELGEAMLTGLMESSYKLVVAGLKKADREALQQS